MKPYPKSCAAVPWLTLLVMSCACLCLGCWRSPAKPPVVAPVPPVVVQTTTEPKVAEPIPVPDASPMPPVETPPTLAPPPVPAVPTEKMLVLSPQGPLVVEFELWIDGEPQVRVFDQLLDEVLKLADTDGDGTPTWKEVVASSRFKYGQFGNLPIDRENAPKQILQQYDTNGNGFVERHELPRFLTRNAGGARAFSVRSAILYHRPNLSGSPTWRAIDMDGDREISAAEIQSAAAQLRMNDADDDEILLVDELRPTSDVDPTVPMRSLGKFGDFTRQLGDHANWDSIRSALEVRYAGGGSLYPEAFRLMSEVFTYIDEDGDGKFSKKELPRLNDVPPHLRLRIEFGTAGTTTSVTTAESTPEPSGEALPSPTTVKFLSSRLTEAQTGGQLPEVIEHPGRVVLRWPGVSLTFARNDTIATIDYDAQAEQGVKMYDANADGYLEASEVNEQVQAQFARFEALDGDADGKVYPGEIAAFLKQRQGAQRAQIHARGQDQEDALFLALDQNADDRLDAQELEQAAARLLALDVNQDGRVTADELTEGIAIVIARGSVENANQLFVVAPVESRPSTSKVPAWFSAMDTSQDGVISAREFLGSPEKFATLDTNQNGFFEPSEIPQAPESTASATPANSSPDDAPADDSERKEP